MLYVACIIGKIQHALKTDAQAALFNFRTTLI